uniref:Major facilitator superfamily (MFS) profile domain-containing protein n=1 Tax=Junco hyemalis TaxID=40217 RepID=A0A8C5IVG9_JUNHY
MSWCEGCAGIRSSGCVPSSLQVQYRRLLLMLVCLGGMKISFLCQYIQKFINETWLERYGSVLPQERLTLLWSLIVSAYCLGGMIGCLCSGYLTAAFGKKKSLLFNDVVLITAALLTACSRRAKAFEMILAGRFLEGIAAGIHMNAHVQYAGEISPKKLRGFINVTSSVFLALGKTVARILGLRCLCCSFSVCFIFIFLLYSREVVFSQSWNHTYTKGGVLFCSGIAVREEASTPYKSLRFPCSFPGDRKAFSWERMTQSLEVQLIRKDCM